VSAVEGCLQMRTFKLFVAKKLKSFLIIIGFQHRQGRGGWGSVFKTQGRSIFIVLCGHHLWTILKLKIRLMQN